MLASIYKIDFIATTGGATTALLAWGDWIDREIEWPMLAQSQTYSAIGAQWGKARGMGGARRPIDFARYAEHASHAAAAAYCLSHPASLPTMTPGKIRVSVNAATPIIYDLMDAVITEAIARMSHEGDFATLTSYHIEAGKTIYVSG